MDKAQDRREREIASLAEMRIRVVKLEQGHYKIGVLDLWTREGRWRNELTKHRGRMGPISMPELVRREHLIAAEANRAYLEEIHAYMREHRRHMREHRHREAWVHEMLDDEHLWAFVEQSP